MIATPLKIAPSLHPKIWGGERMAALGKRLPPEPIGESLESGTDSKVDGGRFSGMTLGELAACEPLALLGPRGVYERGDRDVFPLLVKFIDAHEDLSVQVHPDDAGAPSGKRGKCEAWLIVEADPGASIVTGMPAPIDRQRIPEQVTRTIVAPGDVFLVPPGTVHSIGAGVLLYEVQQASDVTWRLHDWGRARDLHVEEGLRAAVPGAHALPMRPLEFLPGRELLVACGFFALERRRLTDGDRIEALEASCRVMTLLSGSLEVGGEHLAAGGSAVLPADLPIVGVSGDGTALIAWIPDLEHEVRRPLAAAGYAPSDIERVAPHGICDR